MSYTSLTESSHGSHESTRFDEKLDPWTKVKVAVTNNLFVWKNMFLISYMLLEAAMMVIQKRIAQHTGNYPYVLSQLQPICTTVCFGGIYFILEKRSKYRRLAVGEEEVAYPKYKFLILGVLLTIFNFMTFSGSRGDLVPGPLIVLLKQSTIPFTMAISFIFLRKRFALLNYLGASIIITGIVVSILPDLRVLNTSAPMWAVLLLLIGALSISIASVYMEYALKKENVQIFHMWTWVNFFEIWAAMPLMLAIIPIQGIPINDTPENIWDGLRCLFAGINSAKGDSCSYVGYWYAAFITVLIADKSNQAYLIQNNSGALMWVAGACALPIAYFAFTSPFIMGAKADHLSPDLLIGFFLVLVGLLIYRSVEEGVRGRNK